MSHPQPVPPSFYEERRAAAVASSAAAVAARQQLRQAYVQLQQALAALPRRLTHPAMVPLGGVAYARGSLVHTNEVTVLLGDGYFLKCTAAHAAGIAQRRIKDLDKLISEEERMLEGLRLRGDLAAGAWPAAGGEDGGGEMEFFEPFEAEEKGAEAVAVAQPASAAPAASAASASASAPAAATVVERTPPAAATVVERTPPAATTVKERTPPAAATVVERTPPAAATVKERTPPAAATVVERTPVVERNSPTASAKSDSQPFQPGPPSHPQQIGDAKKKAQHISEDEALFEKRYAELLREEQEMERRQKERYERHLLGDASSSETEDDPDRTEAEDAEYAQWQKAQRAAQSGSGTAPTMPATVNLSVTHAGPPPAAVAAASKDPRMWTPSDVTQLSAMLSASASAASPTKKRVTFSADTKGGAGPAAASVKQTPPTEDSTPTTAPLGLVVRERPSASKPVPPSVQQAQLDRRALQARHAELFQQFYRPQSDDDFDEEEDDEDEDGYDETGEYGDEDEGDGDGGAAEVAAIAAPQLSRASPGGALSVMGNVAERETGDAQQPRRELVKPVKVSLFMRQQLQAAGAGKK